MKAFFRRYAGLARRLQASERGATMVEYGLLLALIAVALIGALEFFANERLHSWQQIGSAMP